MRRAVLVIGGVVGVAVGLLLVVPRETLRSLVSELEHQVAMARCQ